MLHDLIEFGIAVSHVSYDNNKGICIQSIDPIDMSAAMPAVISGINHNIMIADDIEMREPSFPINIVPFYPRNYASKDTIEIIDKTLFQKQKRPKDNHPNGWYRKFEKKRY